MDDVENYSIKGRYVDTMMICQAFMYAFADELASGDTVTMNRVCPRLDISDGKWFRQMLWDETIIRVD